jgi:hypothetical protein
MEPLNIIELIETNPISKLSSSSNDRLLTKITEKFSNFEQQMFISSFYCYLNYDKTLDFVVDLDNIWDWLGFSSKQNSIRVLEKHFIKNEDYKEILLPPIEKQDKKNRGGHNAVKFTLTIKCFKSLCLKAQTKKACDIHEYYLKLEDIIHEIFEEETKELKEKLLQKDNIIIEVKQASQQLIENRKRENKKEIEKAIVAQFPVNIECIYFGTIDNTNENNETLIKFGHSNDLSSRVSYHHTNSYKNFILVHAFKVQNRTEIENLIKNCPKIKKQLRKINVGGKNKTEIIAYDAKFTIDRLANHIKDIISARTCNLENFNKVFLENEHNKNKNTELLEQIETKTNKINSLTIEITELKEIIKKQTEDIKVVVENEQSVFEMQEEEDSLTKKFHEFIHKMCNVRHDIEESSSNLEGQFRIWNKEKPKKEVFHALKSYLDTRFKPIRLAIQEKNQIVYGYAGIKLKEIIYKKIYPSPSPVETFIFQVCKFTPSGKILNSTLLNEYKRWKQSVNIAETEDDMKDIKEYLNKSEYAIKATVWATEGSNEGYYGLILKSNEYIHKKTSSTGKKVEKREANTNILICKWETIAKAAESENMSPTKMSSNIKKKTIIDDFFYCTV